MSAATATAEQTMGPSPSTATLSSSERCQFLTALYNEACTQARQQETLRERVVASVQTPSTPAAEKAAEIMESLPPVGVETSLDKPAKKRATRKTLKRKKPQKVAKQKARRTR
jgi:hypothetical protein